MSKPPTHAMNETRASLRPRRARGVLALTALALGAWGVLAPAPDAFADDKPDDQSGAADPTVGTLPSLGGTTELDQSLTLRGDLETIRRAVVRADVLVPTENPGTYEVIELGGDQCWVRFYGDLRLELDADAVAELDLGLFAGFEGEGLAYVVETLSGSSSVQGLAPGEEVLIDPLRILDSGLLDGRPVFLHGVHRTGQQTHVSFEFDAEASTFVVHQD